MIRLHNCYHILLCAKLQYSQWKCNGNTPVLHFDFDICRQIFVPLFYMFNCGISSLLAVEISQSSIKSLIYLLHCAICFCRVSITWNRYPRAGSTMGRSMCPWKERNQSCIPVSLTIIYIHHTYIDQQGPVQYKDHLSQVWRFPCYL